MVRRNEAVVGVLQVRLQRYDGLLGNITYLLHKVSHVLATVHQVFDDCREKLLRRLVIMRKLLSGSFELLGILIQRKVGQVHEKVLDVVVVRLLVVVGAEAS